MRFQDRILIGCDILAHDESDNVVVHVTVEILLTENICSRLYDVFLNAEFIEHLHDTNMNKSVE